ncbi:MAG TPA: hypothetical protein VNZ86_08660 [Bacteroidia bacterium]|jgi:hypothetical protein|nr:hypothetical protein [Bacteroidia bacterium]
MTEQEAQTLTDKEQRLIGKTYIYNKNGFTYTLAEVYPGRHHERDYEVYYDLDPTPETEQKNEPGTIVESVDFITKWKLVS